MSQQRSPSTFLGDLARPVRRKSLLAGAVAAGAALAAGPGLSAVYAAGSPDNRWGDTPKEIFTAALIAEDLATTFYYNGLVGPVIQDVNLAGPGGSATNVTASGNLGNVDYLRAALSEEIAHADLFRALLGIAAPANDPVQTFYFPSGTFDSLGPFIAILEALEDAFIGAYLAAIQEFAAMAADAKANTVLPNGAQLSGQIEAQVQQALAKSGIAVNFPNATGPGYTSAMLEYFAKVAGSILGVEAEHRVLGRVIANINPANNLCFEQTDGIKCVYNGSASAVQALTPFLQGGSGKQAYGFQQAVQNAGAVSLPCTGGLPSD